MAYIKEQQNGSLILKVKLLSIYSSTGSRGKYRVKQSHSNGQKADGFFWKARMIVL